MKRILFVELLGGIGDLVIALPAIHALARSHPNTQITLLTFAPGAELLQADPLVHQVVVANKGEVRQTVESILQRENYDLIVSDTNYDGIANLIEKSNATTVVTNLWRSPPDNERVGDRFLKILQQEGLITPESQSSDTPQIYLNATEKAAAKAALGAAFRPLICLIPDAGMTIKQWPSSHFITVGRALQQKYSATLLVAEGAQPEVAKNIVEAIGGTARVLHRGTLRQFAAIVNEADLAIAADTGPARIAAALNVPTITLFGPSWHGRYGQPLPHKDLQGFPDCPERRIDNFTQQSCWYSGICPFDWKTCVEDISPQRVLEAAEELLSQRLEQSPITAQAVHPVEFSAAQRTPWQSVKRLLVMRLDNVGDVIMTSPALRSLRENLPHAHMTLLASPGGVMVEPLMPWVDEVMPWRVLWQDLGKLGFDPSREWQFVDELRCRRFDAAIIFTSFSQSPHPAGLMCALAGIPLRLGESTEQDAGTLTHAVSPSPIEIHQVERNLRLIEAVGYQVSDRSLTLQIPNSAHQRVEQLLQTTTLNQFPFPYIVLNPWTSCQSRNYDAEKFAIAALQLSEKTGFWVVVTGVEKDCNRADDLLKILRNRAINLIGKTTLPELVALIQKAELILTNNTSTMHIADATRTPSVVLFAGTELESQWQPRHNSSHLLRRSTVCNPCYAFTCPYQLECLKIAPETIVERGLDLLGQQVIPI